MTIHPLFAGFKGEDLYAVAAALGFVAHVDTCLGPLPAVLPTAHAARLLLGGDLAGFYFAGGWGAPGVHCLFFVKPLTALASTCWLAGLGTRVEGWNPSYLHSGVTVLADLQAAGYAAFGDQLGDWPRVVPDDAEKFAEAYALVLDGFAVLTNNVPSSAFEAVALSPG